MALNLDHLGDSEIRTTMVSQWSAEHDDLCARLGLGDRPYGKQFTPAGWDALARYMPDALANFDEEWLEVRLSDPSYWQPTLARRTKSGVIDVVYDKADAARKLAMTEFNMAYVRAVATVGIDRGHSTGELYRAGDAVERRARCTSLEGQQVSLQGLLDDFRCYFPGPVPAGALQVPAGPHCHHSIRLGT